MTMTDHGTAYQPDYKQMSYRAFTDCRWAPSDHITPATICAHLTRPCGHLDDPIPTCDAHAARLRSEPTAERATPCRDCGAVSQISAVRFHTFTGTCRPEGT